MFPDYFALLISSTGPQIFYSLQPPWSQKHLVGITKTFKMKDQSVLIKIYTKKAWNMTFKGIRLVRCFEKLQIYRVTVRCAAVLGGEVPGHHQEQMAQTYIACLLKTHLFSSFPKMCVCGGASIPKMWAYLTTTKWFGASMMSSRCASRLPAWVSPSSSQSIARFPLPWFRILMAAEHLRCTHLPWPNMRTNALVT